MYTQLQIMVAVGTSTAHQIANTMVCIHVASYNYSSYNVGPCIATYIVTYIVHVKLDIVYLLF